MINMMVRLEGGQELQNKLNALVKKVARDIVRKAVREGQKIALSAIKASCCAMVGGEMGGLMSRGLTIRAARRRQEKGAYSLHVLFKKGAEGLVHYTKRRKTLRYHRQTGGQRYFIPAAIEYGHGMRKEQAAMPFYRTATESSRHSVISRVAEVLRQGIEAVAGSG